MKRLLMMLVVGLGLLTAFQNIWAETIKMGYLQHKPHEYLSEHSGKPRGPAITYFETVAAKIGVTVEWVGPLPLTRYLEALKDGTLDGVAVLIFAAEFTNFVDYADKPFHLAQSVFVVRKDNPLTQITSIQDVEGYHVGWLENHPPSKFVQDHLAHLQMDYRETPCGSKSVKKLLLRRIDAIHELDAWTVPFAAKELHLDDQIKVLPLPEPPQPTYVAFSQKSPKSTWLLARFNAAIADMAYGEKDYVKYIQQEFEAVSRP